MVRHRRTGSLRAGKAPAGSRQASHPAGAGLQSPLQGHRLLTSPGAPVEVASAETSSISAGRSFQYYVWLNSSVRGPFLPAYMAPGGHWTDVFVRKLTGDVKLVRAHAQCSTCPVCKSAHAACRSVEALSAESHGLHASPTPTVYAHATVGLEVHAAGCEACVAYPLLEGSAACQRSCIAPTGTASGM